MIRFAPWEPDKADLDAPVTRVARNLRAGANSYRPMPSLTPYTSATLPAPARGLVTTRTTTGQWVIYAATATRLYRFANSAWIDVSRTVGGNYSLADGEFWVFQQFGNKLIAVNSTIAPQVIDIDSGANFAPLAGNPPAGRLLAVVGDFLVLGALGTSPNRVQWSELNDITQWTPNAGLYGLADSNDLPDGGRVTGLAGGEIGYVLQEYSIRRMRFIPGGYPAFEFVRVVDSKGCLSSYGYVSVAGTVYFIAEDGFYSYSGAGLSPIGAWRVNAWFLSNSDTSRISSVYAVADPFRSRVLWFYYSTSTVSMFDSVIIYDWALDKWSHGKHEALIWGSIATPAKTLDSFLTEKLDDIDQLVDSRMWEGGRPTLAAIDGMGRLSFAEGPAMSAQLETQEAEPMTGRRVFISGVRIHTDADEAEIRLGMRERMSDAVVYSGLSRMEKTGMSPVLSSGRYARAEINIPAGVRWTELVGMDFDAQQDGVT